MRCSGLVLALPAVWALLAGASPATPGVPDVKAHAVADATTARGHDNQVVQRVKEAARREAMRREADTQHQQGEQSQQAHQPEQKEQSEQRQQNSGSYQQYMKEYAGPYMSGNGQNWQHYQEQYAGKYMGGSAGSSGSKARAPLSSSNTTGFQLWIGKYLPPGDSENYVQQWTSVASDNTAPMESMYATGPGGYNQYVDSYSSMAGDHPASSASWQSHSQSQITGWNRAMGTTLGKYVPGGSSSYAGSELRARSQTTESQVAGVEDGAHQDSKEALSKSPPAQPAEVAKSSGQAHGKRDVQEDGKEVAGAQHRSWVSPGLSVRLVELEGRLDRLHNTAATSLAEAPANRAKPSVKEIPTIVVSLFVAGGLLLPAAFAFFRSAWWRPRRSELEGVAGLPF